MSEAHRLPVHLRPKASSPTRSEPKTAGLPDLREFGYLPEIEHRNWNAVSTGIEMTLRGLKDRSLTELQQAMGQLEDLMPHLATETSAAKDVLDLEPVSGTSRFAAMILEKFFPAFRAIVKRAELREGAERDMRTLERVNEQVQELRAALEKKVQEAALELAEQGFDPEASRVLKELKEVKNQAHARYSRIDAILDNPLMWENVREVNVSEHHGEIMALIDAYESVTGKKVDRMQTTFSPLAMRIELKELRKAASQEQFSAEETWRASRNALLRRIVQVNTPTS